MVKQIIRNTSGPDGFCDPLIGICPPLWAGHPDLFQIQDHRRVSVEQSHMNTPGPFGITALLISGQYQLKIPVVLLFLLFTVRGSLQPRIIAASGNPGCGTKFFDRKGAAALLHGLADDFKNKRRVVHEQYTYLPVVLSAEIFFRNSTSCFK